MSDLFVYSNVVFSNAGIEKAHEENEPAEMQDQDTGLRRSPDLNVGVLGKRLQLYRQDAKKLRG